MSIAKTADLHERVGDTKRRLKLTNELIERFEVQYAPLGILELWDQLNGRSHKPQARHVRDIVALALVGGGMSDLSADELMHKQGPEQNLHLLSVAQLVVGVTFFPEARLAAGEKKADGSDSVDPKSDQPTTAPATE